MDEEYEILKSSPITINTHEKIVSGNVLVGRKEIIFNQSEDGLKMNINLRWRSAEDTTTYKEATSNLSIDQILKLKEMCSNVISNYEHGQEKFKGVAAFITKLHDKFNEEQLE